MSLFRPRHRRTEQRALTIESVWGDGGTGWSSLTGEHIDFATVIGLDAVAGAVGLLSDVISMLSARAYRDVDGVGRRLDQQPLILTDPSVSIRPIAWKAQWVTSLILWGNAWALVTDEDRLGYPTGLEILDPAGMTVTEKPLSRPVWRYHGAELDHSKVLHVPGRYVRPGSVMGIAPLDRHRDTWGLARAARRYGAEWFRDGAHPSALLGTQPNKALTADEAALVKRRFLASIRGGEPAVLSGGMTYESVQTTPAESELAEVEAQIIGRIARVIGIPAEMIGGATTGGSVTYANREQRAVDLLTYTIDPYLARYEEAMTSVLPRTQYVKMTRGALLRTDLMTRYRAHDIAIRGGFATPNERRRLEDEPPLPDGAGDVALWPPGATSVQATGDDTGDDQ